MRSRRKHEVGASIQLPQGRRHHRARPRFGFWRTLFGSHHHGPPVRAKIKSNAAIANASQVISSAAHVLSFAVSLNMLAMTDLVWKCSRKRDAFQAITKSPCFFDRSRRGLWRSCTRRKNDPHRHASVRNVFSRSASLPQRWTPSDPSHSRPLRRSRCSRAQKPRCAARFGARNTGRDNSLRAWQGRIRAQGAAQGALCSSGS